MMASLSPFNMEHNAAKTLTMHSDSVLHPLRLDTTAGEKKHFHPGVLLIIKLLKHTKHCFMLHSHYQRNVLFLLLLQKISSHLQCLGAASL